MVPDIGAVFGQYTYLASEIAFGAVALWLLVRADALVRAGKTILVLYPLAYVWDWYTLTIGVFSIPLRTGVELAGIPLEEHVFMFVVPGLVLGVHENLSSCREKGRETTSNR
ncbi:lycopene cyclase domain-containing protein [Haladaptatus sp. NG-WS-4]